MGSSGVPAGIQTAPWSSFARAGRAVRGSTGSACPCSWARGAQGPLCHPQRWHSSGTAWPGGQRALAHPCATWISQLSPGFCGRLKPGYLSMSQVWIHGFSHHVPRPGVPHPGLRALCQALWNNHPRINLLFHPLPESGAIPSLTSDLLFNHAIDLPAHH